MSSFIDKEFATHANALALRAQRAELLATNLANADTPKYKARDIDFRTALAEAVGGQESAGLKKTSAGHQGVDQGSISATTRLYRLPYQASIDGNTVNVDMEKAQFAENALQYQASFTFLNGTIKSLMLAIRGE